MILWLLIGGMALVVVACAQMPVPALPRAAGGGAPLRRLLRAPPFLLFLLAASLIQCSHAVYYGFSTLHWRAAGIGDATIGALWAVGVIAEVVLFAFSGVIVRKVGVVPLLLAAATAGVARWTLTAVTTELAWLALAQVGHAFTFGATHLAAMHFIHRAVPPAMAATAQSLYSALAMGVVLASVMILAGVLYQGFGGGAFLAMAAMALLGFGAALLLRRRWSGEAIPL
jgi:PPP family 3-phenylpropionic acid transporter